MFEKIRNRITIELSHFNKLDNNAKILLYSYMVFLMAWPLLAVFVNAYLWRQASDIRLIVSYNLGFFIALPAAFYLNGLLLKRVKASLLYWLGAIGQGIAAFLVIFIPSIDLGRILLYGVWYGLSGGLYWANKNYLTLKLTKGSNRVYYNNLEYAIDLMINIVVPLITGWFIVLGERLNLYTINGAYKILGISALILLIISGYIMQFANLEHEDISQIWLKKPSKEWQMNRLMEIIFWTLSGINWFLPGVLVLMFVGTEGLLGTVESIASGLAALSLYAIGRKTSTRHILKVMVVGIIIFIIGSSLMSIFYGIIGALIYTASVTISGSLRWTSSYTLSMEVMDKEQESGKAESQYPLIFDNELFFNIGRVIGVTGLFIVAHYSSQDFAIRTVVPVFGVLQIIILIPMKYLLNYVHKDEK